MTLSKKQILTLQKGVHCEWLNDGDRIISESFIIEHTNGNCISKEKVRLIIKDLEDSRGNINAEELRNRLRLEQ